MNRPGPASLASTLAGVKPGWYLLIGLFLYAAFVTFLLVGRPAGPASGGERAAMNTMAASGQGAAPDAAGLSSGLWFPVPGARLPASDDNLPNAPRAYRHGVSQGFDFYGQDSQVPIQTGTPVVAAAAGQVIRADAAYTEMDPRAWEVLMQDVAKAGADDGELDKLRGRQVWLRLADGTVLRYGHLSGLQGGIRTGVTVYRGQVLGFAGNSGTEAAVAGLPDKPRLRFEIWPEPDQFFGAGMEPEDVRMAAASLFVGP